MNNTRYVLQYNKLTSTWIKIKITNLGKTIVITLSIVPYIIYLFKPFRNNDFSNLD
jgi:hypothetical protein